MYQLDQESSSTNHYYKSRANTLVSDTGATVMKLIEVKESISYIFTDIIPIFDKEKTIDKISFVEKEGFWTAAHFVCGIAFSFAVPGVDALSTASKLLAPISATSLYVLRHYYHSELKQNLLGQEAANSCLFNIAMDAGFGALTSLPIAFMTGSPILMLYGAGQSAIIAATSCLSSDRESTWTGYNAGNIVAAAALYNGFSSAGLTTNFAGIMLAVNKLATTLTTITLAHKVASKIIGQIEDNIVNHISSNNNEVHKSIEGDLQQNDQWFFE